MLVFISGAHTRAYVGATALRSQVAHHGFPSIFDSSKSSPPPIQLEDILGGCQEASEGNTA